MRPGPVPYGLDEVEVVHLLRERRGVVAFSVMLPREETARCLTLAVGPEGTPTWYAVTTDVPSDADVFDGSVRPGGDDEFTVFSSLGIVRCEVRDGHVGDVAVMMARRAVELRPELGAVERMDIVRAAQRRLMWLGLARVVEALGPDRLLAFDAFEGKLTLVGFSTMPLRLPSVVAREVRVALETWPPLANLVVSGAARIRGTCGGPEARAAASLAPMVEDGTRAHSLLRHVPGTDLGFVMDGSTVKLMTLVPRDWLPKGRDEWTAFHDVAVTLLRAAANTGQPVSVLAAACKGRWVEFMTRLCRTVDAAAYDPAVGLRKGSRLDVVLFDDVATHANDLNDMTVAFVEEVLAPCAAFLGHGSLADSAVSDHTRDGPLRRAGKDLLYSGRGLVRVLETSAVWHRRGTTTGSEGEAYSWKPATVPFHDPDTGLTVVELSSRAALQDEGVTGPDRRGREGLSHCVGSYWRRCLTGETTVLSVRRPDGHGGFVRVSTAECRLSAAGPVEVRQHRGPGNSSPDVLAERALEAFRSALADRKIALDADATGAMRRRARSLRLEDRCGYDWRDRKEVARALSAWAPYLAASLRGLTPEELGGTFVPSSEPDGASEAPAP